MRVQLARDTFDFNVKHGLYYDNAERSFRDHTYLGLYKDKSVRAIGKVVARITAVIKDGNIEYETEYGELTDERKETISIAISNADSYGHCLSWIKSRYFFVDKFYETDFKKITKYAPRGSRVFDLTKILGTDILPKIEEIARELNNKTWD